MIEDGFTYVALLVMIGSAIVYTEKKSRHKLFAYLPSIVILYFVVMLFSTFELWQKTESISNTYKYLKSNLLPAMIFLMLLSADMREIFKLVKKILLIFSFFSIFRQMSLYLSAIFSFFFILEHSFRKEIAVSEKLH